MDKKNQDLLPDLRSKMTDKALQKASDAEQEMAFWSRLQRFMTIVNGAVEAEKLQAHPIVRDCKYLPISHMEMALDEVFFGQWNTINFKWQVISNEVVASLELEVFHPLTKSWVKRTGATAITIMTDSIPEPIKKGMTKQQQNAWAVDIQNKKPGALANGGFAKLKAECFKNACVSLGKYFGRDVNREHQADEYLGTIKDPHERKNELRTLISDKLRDNQDLEFVQGIANEITEAEDSGKNTIDFYKGILTKITPKNADNN